MTLNEYLEQKEWIMQSIYCKRAKIRFYQDRATNCTVSYSLTSGCSGTRNNHPMEGAIVDALAVQESLADEEAQLKALNDRFLIEINKLNNATYRLVLELKLINNASWKEIAYSAKYSVSSAHRYYRRAVEVLDRVTSTENENLTPADTP